MAHHWRSKFFLHVWGNFHRSQHLEIWQISFNNKIEVDAIWKAPILPIISAIFIFFTKMSYFARFLFHFLVICSNLPKFSQVNWIEVTNLAKSQQKAWKSFPMRRNWCWNHFTFVSSANYTYILIHILVINSI